MAEGEKIIQINISDEMKSAYIDYSMSVIVSRALPDVRDGLKPVHRRVLYGMLDLGVLSNRPYKKSARIVGEVLGKVPPSWRQLGVRHHGSHGPTLVIALPDGGWPRKLWLD